MAVAGVPQAHQELGEVGGGAVVAAVGGHDAVRGVRRSRGENRVNFHENLISSEVVALST